MILIPLLPLTPLTLILTLMLRLIVTDATDDGPVADDGKAVTDDLEPVTGVTPCCLMFPSCEACPRLL